MRKDTEPSKAAYKTALFIRVQVKKTGRALFTPSQSYQRIYYTPDCYGSITREAVRTEKAENVIEKLPLCSEKINLHAYTRFMLESDHD
jgi:hypothetical protein